MVAPSTGIVFKRMPLSTPQVRCRAVCHRVWGVGPHPIVTLPWPAQCKKVLSSFLGYQGWSSSVVQLTRLPAPSPSSRSCVSVRFQAEVEVLFTRCGLLVTGIGEAVVDTERSYGTAIEVRDISSVHALAACQVAH